MNNLCALVIVSAFVTTSCSYQSSSQLFMPTAPDAVTGVAGTTAPPSSSTVTNPAGSAFGGTWASSTIAGLPIGNCSNVKWVITEQSGSAVSGNVTATCAGGSTVAATLTGQMKSATVMALTANGTMTAMGIPCPFSLEGTGTRQADDSMKLQYDGKYCLGAVSGTEVLRRFPAP
jgi:hypothetical protein